MSITFDSKFVYIMGISGAYTHEQAEEILAELSKVVIAAQQSVHPTNGGLALRACVNANCGWVGKESACLTWKHAGDERMCPHCHDNTESIPLSAISG